jgi:lipoyl-dependent peroxiredoxin
MALAERTAHVQWQGTLVRGSGEVELGSGAASMTLDWASRDEKAEDRTSPEELLAAAHASCYAETFALLLTRQGVEPERIDVRATCTLQPDGDWFRITTMDLSLDADAPGIEGEKLQRLAEEADAGCAISRALRGDVEVRVRVAQHAG